MNRRAQADIRSLLEGIYGCYHRRDLVHPDPLEFLYRYDDPSDREIAGLVAASLAYGRVAQILNSVESALAPLGPSPRAFLEDATRARLNGAYADFRHRFTSGSELAALLWGARQAARAHGSLHACFTQGFGRGDEDVLPAAASFVERLNRCAGADLGYLLPSPARGSACKRLLLYLRWMVRRDEVDPGGWDGDVPARMLVVPLDTHLHRIARALGFTRRASADLKAAREVTASFRLLRPDDPVKYDFSLTRIGIRPEIGLDEHLALFRKAARGGR